MESGKVPGLLDTDLWTLTDTPPVTKEGVLIGLYLWQPLTGAAGIYTRDVTEGTEEFRYSLFPLPLVLLPIFLYWFKRPGPLRRGPLLAMLLMSMIVGMGPMVVIADQVFTNPFYMYTAKGVSFIRRLWWPGRIAGLGAILGYLVFPVVLAGHRYRRPAAIAGSFGMIAAMFVAKLLPMVTWEAYVPAGYRCLATGPKGAVIELPYSFTQGHLYYQTVHQRPIFGGMVEDNPVFSPDEFVAMRKKNTFVRRILELTRLMKSDVEWTEADKAELRELGYRYVVVQKDAFTTEPTAPKAQQELQSVRLRKLERDLRAMMGPPVFTDARSSIYAPWGDPMPCDLESVGVDRVKQAAPFFNLTAQLVAWTVPLSRPFGEALIVGSVPWDQAGEAPPQPSATAPSDGSTTAGTAAPAPGEAAPAPEGTAPEGATPAPGGPPPDGMTAPVNQPASPAPKGQ
jgi:hypothetical protein